MNRQELENVRLKTLLDVVSEWRANPGDPAHQRERLVESNLALNAYHCVTVQLAQLDAAQAGEAEKIQKKLLLNMRDAHAWILRHLETSVQGPTPALEKAIALLNAALAEGGGE